MVHHRGSLNHTYSGMGALTPQLRSAEEYLGVLYCPGSL